MIFSSNYKGLVTRKPVVRHFTLVEILMVLLIIAVLLGIGIKVYSVAMTSSKRAKTQTTIKKLEVTIENLKVKYGVYPQTSSDKYFHIDKITSAVSSGMGLENMTDYDAEFKKNIDYESIKNSASTGTAGDLVITDAWGNKLIYVCPGAKNTKAFDIVSPGPDKGFGAAKAATYPSSYSSANCDDMTSYDNN